MISIHEQNKGEVSLSENAFTCASGNHGKKARINFPSGKGTFGKIVLESVHKPHVLEPCWYTKSFFQKEHFFFHILLSRDFPLFC